MKWTNYAMMAFFAYAAIVQINDPDPVPWLLAYLGGVAFCGLWSLEEFPTTLAFVFAGACLVTSLILFVKVLESDVWEWGEKVSEPLGLLLLFLWVSTLAWLDWKQKGQASLA